jgi:hypothetical protein
MNNPAILFLRFLVVDVAFDVLRFPLWWYQHGVVAGFRWWVQQLEGGEARLALIVLMKNLGRPMFGDYTREGRAISFGVRLVQLVVSIALFIVWFAVITVLWFSWFLLFPAILLLLIYLLGYG